MCKPTIKDDRSITLHKDGTVSFWSVFKQMWERRSHVPHNELAQMNRETYQKIKAHIPAHYF